VGEWAETAWHARGQGFKSPQLHPRSTALPAVNRPRIARLGQQIGSNLFCQGRSGRAARQGAVGVVALVDPGPPGAAGGSVVRYEGPDRPSSTRSITDERHGDFVRLVERLDPCGAFRNQWLQSRVLGNA
jgi:hypothetical protein